MIYTYEITPRPAAVGGGWRLRLLQDGEEVGGGVFPLTDDLQAAFDDAEAEAEAWMSSRPQV